MLFSLFVSLTFELTSNTHQIPEIAERFNPRLIFLIQIRIKKATRSSAIRMYLEPYCDTVIHAKPSFVSEARRFLDSTSK